MRKSATKNEWKVLIRSQLQQKKGAMRLCNDIQNFVIENEQQLLAEYKTKSNIIDIIKSGRNLFNSESGFATSMDINIIKIVQMFYENKYQIMIIDCKTGDQLFVGHNAEQTIYLRFTSGGH